MPLQAKLDFFVPTILDWSREHGRHDLPWRQAPSPYQVWVSEVMLQQTQVGRVIPYYERFLKRFPTIESLAKTTWEEFLPYYAGLGYYRRGRNMLATAQVIMSQHHGQFPQNKQALLNLPGVGEYTANALLSFGFHQPHLAFDTNQQRVFGRYLEGDKQAQLDPNHIESNLPPSTNFRQLNGAIMDFANLVCTNRSPSCQTCPLQPHCVYAQTKGVQEQTRTKSAERFPYRSAQAIVFLHENHHKYYSSHHERYEPFSLPIGLTSRSQIKAYFRQKYNLELAVRPPFAKGIKNDQPFLLVNAQILLGQPLFNEHAQEDTQDVRRGYQEGL